MFTWIKKIFTQAPARRPPELWDWIVYNFESDELTVEAAWWVIDEQGFLVFYDAFDSALAIFAPGVVRHVLRKNHEL